MKFIRKTYDWMGEKVHSKHSKLWLSLLFFIEAIFFIPVDPILILFCIKNNKKSLSYAAIATISSVSGGIFGYMIGNLMWKSIGTNLVNLFITPQTFYKAILKYKLYQNWAVLIAGFTPIPYKAITLSAGFCNLPIIPFVLFSFIARGSRFFLISLLIKIWGPQIKGIIDRYFNQLVLLFLIILILSFWIIK